MAEDMKRKRREQHTVSWSVLREAKDKLNLTNAALAEALGFGSSALSKWEKQGRVPLSVALACEGLVRRQGSDFKPHYGDRVWLLRLSPDQQGVVGPILKAMSIKWTEV